MYWLWVLGNWFCKHGWLDKELIPLSVRRNEGIRNVATHSNLGSYGAGTAREVTFEFTVAVAIV